MLGVWATLVSKASTYDLYTPESGGEDVLGWLDGQTVILYSFFANCSTQNIRAVNVSTRKVTPLWKGAFNEGQIAFDPTSGAFLLQADDFSSFDGCPQNGQGPGGYLVDRDGHATKISDSTSGLPIWSKEAGAFFYPSGNIVEARRPDGSSLTTPAALSNPPVVSPDGKAYVWQNATGGIDLSLNGISQTITNLPPATPDSPLDASGTSEVFMPAMIWKQDSSGFVFTSGQELYAAQAADDFKPIQVTNMDMEMQATDQYLFRVDP